MLAVLVLALMLLRVSQAKLDSEKSNLASIVNTATIDTPIQSIPADAFPSFTPSQVTDSTIETPADAWAIAALDLLLPMIELNTIDEQKSVKWGSSIGDLTWQNNRVAVAQQPVDILSDYTIQITAGNDQHPTSPLPIGEITPVGRALALTIANAQADRWLLSSTSSILPLKALFTQTELRGIILQGFASTKAGSVLQIVFVGIKRTNIVVDSPTDVSTSITERSPLPTLIPTATRALDSYLGQFVAGKIDPAIDQAQAISPAATRDFLDRHSWAGLLTSSETGLQVAGRNIDVSHATELTVYLVEDQSKPSDVSRLFTVQYNAEEQTTHFPEDRILFQAHRMDEAVYWIVVRAAERGGQIIAAYDNYGEKQSLTVIGFKPLTPSDY